MVASDLFRTASQGRRVRCLLCTRQDMPALDLEHLRMVSASLAIKNAEKQRLLADLHRSKSTFWGSTTPLGTSLLAEPARLLDRVFPAGRRGPEVLFGPARSTSSLALKMEYYRPRKLASSQHNE